MNVEDFVFDLPEELIAAYPAARRDESRLFVVPQNPADGFLHRRFDDMLEYLRPGDVLVMNDSRVIPARLFGERRGGGRTELLLLEEEGSTPDVPQWRAMVKPARKARPGDQFVIAPGRLTAEVTEAHDNGERTIRFQCTENFRTLLSEFGHTPLPPYILKRRRHESHLADDQLDVAEDRIRYQTVYARLEGSVAAPTAGLHFTPELLEAARAKGVETHWVTLHVGAGTFAGMEPGTRVEDHAMHTEHFFIADETAEAINKAKHEGRRVVAVGTTTVRTLESAAGKDGVAAGANHTQMMIAPGYRMKVVDSLITNFHLPRSTLLLLVSAMVGRERLLAAYEEAVRKEYRFFSYGDAMLIE